MKNVKNLTSELKDLTLNDIYENHASSVNGEGVNPGQSMSDTSDETKSIITLSTQLFGEGIKLKDINNEYDLIIWKVNYKNIDCLIVCEIPTPESGGYNTIIPGKTYDSTEDYDIAEELYSKLIAESGTLQHALIRVGFDFTPEDIEKTKQFKDLLFEMITNLIVCGMNPYFHAQELSMTFQGDAAVIRKVLISWFPNLTNDDDWDKVVQQSSSDNE